MNSVGYLIPQFPGQTHIFFWREIKELEKRGTKVTIFSTQLPAPGLISHSWSEAAIARTIYIGKPQPLEALRALFNIAFSNIKPGLHRESLGMLWDIAICASAARRLAVLCAARSISHVHVHSCGRSALIAALANRMTGLNYSLTLHGPLSDYGTGQRLKWCHAAFATVITNKLLSEVKASLGNDLPPSIVVQAMGVDVEAFARTKAYKPPVAGESVRLFSCGRLNPVKGHQDLIAAVRLLVDRGIDICLDIAGEDDAGGSGFRCNLEDQIRNLGLDSRVRLLGAVDEAEVKRSLLKAHIFVLASWHEPLGVSYMEAMSCEVPTIGTDSGGIRELIDCDSGLLVKPKDPAALADAIAGLASDPALSLRISGAGRARVVKHFRSSIGAETLLEEIRKSTYRSPGPVNDRLEQAK